MFGLRAREIDFPRPRKHLRHKSARISLIKHSPLLLLATLLCAACTRAQSEPQCGSKDLELWTGGGYAVNGGVEHIAEWNVGARYGWILTRSHGKGFLKGKFEYAVDVEPAFLVIQQPKVAYGVGINPIVLKWNFDTRRRIAPYLELGGGPLLTDQRVPAGISRINFTPGGAAGLQFLREKYHWSAELRFLHISDAGLTSSNPGINTIQIRFGIGLFTRTRPPN